MVRHKIGRFTLVATILLIVGGVACTLLIWGEQRQYRLNRELVRALIEGNGKQALALVEAGADPNTRFIPLPPPTWRELLNQLVKHPAPSSNNSPTAFMVACGTPCRGPRFSDPHFSATPIWTIFILLDPHMTQVAKSMLLHGANINARDQYGSTALISVSRNGSIDIMPLILEHGAMVDLQDDDGRTALYYAARRSEPEAVKLLLKYHADLKVRDKDGETPLTNALRYNASPEIIRLLKNAGATK